MESLESDCRSQEAQQADMNTETSRLVGPNTGTKPCYINLASNLCALILLGVITFCCFKDGVNLFSFHPILMTLGWLLFMTTAINAVSPGDLASEWMPIRLRSARHWVLQVCGGIIILCGFLIILSNKIIGEKPHFVTLHAKFGISSLTLMICTMLGGLGALYSLKLKHYLAPMYTKLIHAFVGIFTFSLGVITIILGFFSNWWTFGDILRYSCLLLALLVTLFTVLRPSLKIYFRLKERFDNAN